MQELQAKKVRSSNFELCRLACMFYIVVYHLFIHNKDVTGDAFYRVPLTTIFSIGVPVFVMISGYFRIHATLKGFLNIVTEVIFYCLVADLLCLYVFHEKISTENILSTFLPFSKSEYWFVGTYLLLYVLSPFINRFLDAISKQELCIFLVTLTVLVCYGGGIMNPHETDYGDKTILTFTYLYSLGYFVRNHLESLKINKYKVLNHPWLLYITTMIVFFVIVQYYPFIISKGINYLAHSYNSIGLVLFSLMFFLCFKSLRIQNKWINWVAKSTFSIYLIHGNNIVSSHRWFYDIYTRYGLEINSIYLRLGWLLIAAFIICSLCVLIDLFRRIFFKYSGIDLLIIKADKYISSKVEFSL